MIIVIVGGLAKTEMQRLSESTMEYAEAMFNEIIKECSEEAMGIVNDWRNGNSVFTEEYEKLPCYEEAYNYIMTLIFIQFIKFNYT